MYRLRCAGSTLSLSQRQRSLLGMASASELDVKLARLGEFLDAHGLDGVLVTERANFAWITGGRTNRIANNTPVGVASILATRESRICLANSIEAPRMKNEELAGTGIEVIEFPWYDGDATQRIVRETIGGRKIACDSVAFGLQMPSIPPGFGTLRWSLTDAEIERYREAGRRAAAGMERAARALRPGLSEDDAAALVDAQVHHAGMNPLVVLVASDDRITRFRHPVPTAKKIERTVMLVSCAEYSGLVTCLTRFVNFGALSEQQRTRHRTICDIDATINLATRPGRTLGQMFNEIQQAYLSHGFGGQWQFHHQGGSTGYLPREVVATPSSTVPVLENQAFAWNPSVTGAKCEDTVLVTTDGIEVLTAATAEWPKVTGHGAGGTLARAGILEL